MRDALTLLGVLAPLLVAVAYHVGCARGITTGRALADQEAVDRGVARMHRLLADIRNPHPLCHRIIRYEATCPADAIALLLTSARRAQEEAP